MTKQVKIGKHRINLDENESVLYRASKHNLFLTHMFVVFIIILLAAEIINLKELVAHGIPAAIVFNLLILIGFICSIYEYVAYYSIDVMFTNKRLFYTKFFKLTTIPITQISFTTHVSAFGTPVDHITISDNKKYSLNYINSEIFKKMFTFYMEKYEKTDNFDFDIKQDKNLLTENIKQLVTMLLIIFIAAGGMLQLSGYMKAKQQKQYYTPAHHGSSCNVDACD